MLMAIIGSLSAIAGVGLVIGGILLNQRPNEIQSRLSAFATAPRSLEDIELQQPFYDRIIKPIVLRIAKIVSSRTPQSTVATLRHDLMVAGNPRGLQVNDFLGIKGLTSVLLGCLILLVMVTTNAPLLYRLIGPFIFAVLGFYFPNFWLHARIRSRQHQIQKALPDCLDLLVISVEAGLGFDAAIQKVTEKWSNDLTYEFSRVLAEIRMGKHRREALRDMANRVEVADVNSFIAAVIQADQLGVSIGRIFNIQAEAMRVKRRQRAEKLAHEAPVKMLIPMAIFMLPTIYMIILGPMIPKLVTVFGGGM